MSLVNCKECGKEVSDKAINCPHCGFKMNLSDGMKTVNGLAWMFIIFMILSLLIGFLTLK